MSNPKPPAIPAPRQDRAVLVPQAAEFTLMLDNVGNPDFHQDPDRRLPGTRARTVKVKDLAEVREAVQAYVRDYDLGGGNFKGTLHAGPEYGRHLLANISYNGRAWDPSDKTGMKPFTEEDLDRFREGRPITVPPSPPRADALEALATLPGNPPLKLGEPGEALLRHPAYHQSLRLKGYTRARTPLQMLTPEDTAKALIRNNPAWTKEDHQRLAESHRLAASFHLDAWDEVVNEAAMETWGRPYLGTDYRISGIASYEFPESFKERLRHHAHTGSDHRQLASGHEEAARRRNLYGDRGKP